MSKHGLVHGSMSGVRDRLKEVPKPTMLGSQDAVAPSEGWHLSVGALTPSSGKVSPDRDDSAS